MFVAEAIKINVRLFSCWGKELKVLAVINLRNSSDSSFPAGHEMAEKVAFSGTKILITVDFTFWIVFFYYDYYNYYDLLTVITDSLAHINARPADPSKALNIFKSHL